MPFVRLRGCIHNTEVAEMTCDADHYWEGPYLVFTGSHHLRRGYCCGSRCRHCPFEPRFEKGTKTARASLAAPGGEP